MTRKQLLAAGGLALVVATVFFLLPMIADYGDVWDVVTQLTWGWVVALLAITAVNLATFAALDGDVARAALRPGVRSQRGRRPRSRSSSPAAPRPEPRHPSGCCAAGVRQARDHSCDHARLAVEPVPQPGVPDRAVFLLTISGEGERTALLATAAFVDRRAPGQGHGFVLVLTSGRLAFAVGERTARLASWALRKVRRGPVT